MTEREYLATLSDEELAEKLQDECCLCTFQNRTNGDCDATDNVEDICKKGILLFLKSEHREMKRCPCCGEGYAPTLFTEKDEKQNKFKFYVECFTAAGGCGLRTKTTSTQQEAVDAWNRRAGD